MHVSRDDPTNAVLSSDVFRVNWYRFQRRKTDAVPTIAFQKLSNVYAPKTAVFAPLERSNCTWSEEDEFDQASSIRVSDESVESMPFDTVDKTKTDPNVT